MTGVQTCALPISAERHVVDEGNQRTIELYAEEPRPLKLEKRVVEKVKPVVYERTIQSIQDGNVVEQKVEALEPKVDLQLREHIGYVDNSSLGVSPYVTKNEMVNTVVEAVKAFAASQPTVRDIGPQPSFAAQSFVPKSIQDEISDRLNATKQEGMKPLDIILSVFMVANIGLFAFLVISKYFAA